MNIATDDQMRELIGWMMDPWRPSPRIPDAIRVAYRDPCVWGALAYTDFYPMGRYGRPLAVPCDRFWELYDEGAKPCTSAT